jgi:hypothetical protein
LHIISDYANLQLFLIPVSLAFFIPQGYRPLIQTNVRVFGQHGVFDGAAVRGRLLVAAFGAGERQF